MTPILLLSGMTVVEQAQYNLFADNVDTLAIRGDDVRSPVGTRGDDAGVECSMW